MGVPDGCCFGTGRAGQDDERCAGIERGDNSCGQDGGINLGGEGEAKVDEGTASKVGSNRRGVGVKDILHPLQRGLCRLAVNRRDLRVFEVLGELVDGGGRHGGGLTN